MCVLFQMMGWMDGLPLIELPLIERELQPDRVPNGITAFGVEMAPFF